MMRLLAIIPVYAFCVITALVSPFAGLLSFSWLAYMRPQSLLWGTESDWRISYIVAIALIIGFLFKGGKEKFFVKTRENQTLIMLWAVLASCSLFSIWPQNSFPKVTELSKIFLIAIFTGGLINTRRRFKYLACVIALSLAYWGVKGGIMAPLRGLRLHGPLESMIADNNDYALALNMVLPFFIFLGKNETAKFKKLFFYLQFPFIISAIIYTYSRGGFLGACAVMLILTLKSKRKVIGFLLLGICAILFFQFAPQGYKDRIETIKTYEQDESAMARIYAWQAAIAMIKDKPLTGVGLRNFKIAYPSYHWSRPYVAHNSYLQIAAESGLPALLLFVLLLLFSIGKLRRLRKAVGNKPQVQWFRNYTHMLEVGLIGYMVSGFFLSRHDFDLMYQFIGMVVALEHIARKEKLITKNAK